MDHIKETLDKKTVNSSNSSTVNGKDQSVPTVNSKTTVNSYKSVSEKIDEFIEEEGITPQGVAQKLSEDLEDSKSYEYYVILAKNNPIGKLLEALSYTNEASRKGAIRTKKAIYFQSILRRWGLKTKFKQ